MQILLTGSNGFLGQHLYHILCKKNTVITCDLNNSSFNCDLSQFIPKLDDNFDIVIHAAGKVHLNPTSKEEMDMFFQVNFIGTKNLCAALERSFFPKALIFISTVSVYGVESGTNISESHSLNGYSPYALSKIQAEKYLIDWCKKNKVKLGILRPSLIAGKNPPGNLGAMIKSIKSGKYFRIGKGSSRKSILMAEDIAKVIPKLAKLGVFIMFVIIDIPHLLNWKKQYPNN